MLQSDIEPLLNVFRRRLAGVQTTFKRYLYNQIEWTDRLIGIRGARGVGKTTLLLQYIKENFKDKSKVFWVSLDNLWFKTNSLSELVEYLYNQGVTSLFFDEVHKFKDWSLYLKNFYDGYPDLQIVYTGSSMLEIDNSKADLSRRQILYTLGNMSFREYLEFTKTITLAPVSIEELLKNHIDIAMEIMPKIKVLKCFGDYLKQGCYPFTGEIKGGFYMRLNSVIQLVIESDMPASVDVSYSTVEKTKTLLMLTVSNVPFEVNISRLAESLGSNRDSCLKMLYTLDKGNIISLLTKDTKNYRHLTAPSKVYLYNTNLMYALSNKIDIGTLRETFFFNQMQLLFDVRYPKTGDFLVDNK
ncbi:MAG: AAA family ATPase, partial [Bacteroidales bacterium]|nr:AAA family ATPase [Bacteroidales bacterium]